jgi:hypothetical protein
VGFAPELWQVEQPKPQRKATESVPAVTSANGQSNGHRNGSTPNGGRPAPPPPAAATAEASRPGIVPPVSGDSARLVVTLFETEDVLADEALLKAIVSMLKTSPGKDEVRLVIHDSEGQETEYDLPRASATEDLARSIRAVLRTNGQVRLTGVRMVGAA